MHLFTLTEGGGGGGTGERHRIARERLIRRRTGSALSRCEAGRGGAVQFSVN